MNSGLTTELRWLLEGHSLHGNDASYIKTTPDDLLEQFEKAHDDLVIEPSMRMRRKIEKLEVEASQLQRLQVAVKALEAKMKQVIFYLMFLFIRTFIDI